MRSLGLRQAHATSAALTSSGVKKAPDRLCEYSGASTFMATTLPTTARLATSLPHGTYNEHTCLPSCTRISIAPSPYDVTIILIGIGKRWARPPLGAITIGFPSSEICVEISVMSIGRRMRERDTGDVMGQYGSGNHR